MDLEAIGEYAVEDVVLKQPYSFMASDQKGPNVILSFSQQCNHCISQQFVNVSLENKDTILEDICKYDRLSIPRSVLHIITTAARNSAYFRIPALLCSDSGARREQCLVGAGARRGVFSLLASSGLVTLVSPDIGDTGNRQFYPVFGICDDFDTFYDELHIYQDKIVVMKIFRNLELSIGDKLTVLSVSNFKGQLLWKHNVNPVLSKIMSLFYILYLMCRACPGVTRGST